MPTLLHIDASPRGDYSISRQVSAAFAESWKEQHPDGTVIRRDLTTTKDLTFVDLNWIMGAFSAPDQHTEEHKKALEISDLLISELLSADHVIIGTPMYNFNVPAILKAWIDHIVRMGKTFNIGPTGVDGLAKGRKVTVTVASGSDFSAGSPLAAYNAETPYLKNLFAFIGITDVEFVMAGGTNDVNQGKVQPQDFLAPHLAEAQRLATA